MKNLFRLTILTFLLFGGIKSKAQTIEIKTGLNLSTMYFKNSGGTYSDDFELAPGFLLGITKGVPVSESFSLETGLLFSSKGYKIETNYPVPTSSGEYLPINERATLNYLDLPVSLKLATSKKKMQLFGILGSYMAIGLSGKVSRKKSGSLGGFVPDGTIEYTGEMGKDGQWERFDYGIQSGVGVIIQKIAFRINYSYGLANIAQYDNTTNKNRKLGISLGCIINN